MPYGSSRTFKKEVWRTGYGDVSGRSLSDSGDPKGWS